MKKIIKITALALAIYLIGCFLTWELNPGNWHEAARVVAVFALVVTVLLITAYQDINP